MLKDDLGIMPEHHSGIAASISTNVTDGLTKNYSAFSSLLTFGVVRGGAAKNG